MSAGARTWLMRLAGLALVAILMSCARAIGPPSEADLLCAAAEVPSTKDTHVPRPDHELATFAFPGNAPEQLEYVFVHEDGSYDYIERWGIGIPGNLEHQREVGWDWKVGCRMHVCPLPDGGHCCHQVCEDGGDSGVVWEPPDSFHCMNSSAGGDYDWFVEGLRDGGMDALDACFAESGSAG